MNGTTRAIVRAYLLLGNSEPMTRSRKGQSDSTRHAHARRHSIDLRQLRLARRAMAVTG